MNSQCFYILSIVLLSHTVSAFPKKKEIKNINRDLPFLKYSSLQTQKDVLEVISESQLTYDEKEELIADIVARDTERVQKDFEKFRVEMQKKRTQREKIMSDAKEKMSEDAKNVDDQIEEIMKNSELSPFEKRKMIRDIFEGLNSKVRKELMNMHSKVKKTAKRALRGISSFLRNASGKEEMNGKLEVKKIQMTKDGELIQFDVPEVL